MIIADTSVWADHLQRSDARLAKLLSEGNLLMHPFVLGEIALGFLRKRSLILESLQHIPSTHIADPEEVLHLVDRHQLIGVGIGYVDVHLIAATLVTDNCLLWTRDKRLASAALKLGIAAEAVN